MNNLSAVIIFGFVFILFAVLVGFLIYWGRGYERRRVESILGALEQLGLPVKIKEDREQYLTKYNGRPLLLTLVDRSGSETEWTLNLTARLRNPDGYQLWLVPAKGGAGMAAGLIGAMMGMNGKYVKVGDRHFDEQFRVAAVPPGLVQTIFADSHLRAEIHQVPLIAVHADGDDLKFTPNIQNAMLKSPEQLRLYLDIISQIANEWDRFVEARGR